MEKAEAGFTELNSGIPCIHVIDSKRAFNLRLLEKVVPVDRLDKSVNQLAEKLAQKTPISVREEERSVKKENKVREELCLRSI